MSANASANASANGLLRELLLGQRWWVGLGSALVTVHQACEALVLVVVGAVIDRAVATGDAGSLLFWVGLLALLFACLSASGCTAVWVNEKAALNVAHEARLRVTRRVLDPAGVAAERSAPPGEMVSLATSDADRVGEAAHALASLAGALSALAVSAVVLFGISVPMGLVVLLGLPPLLYAIHLVVKPLTARAEAEQAAVAGAASVATDLVSGLRVLKGLGAEGTAAARYRTASRRSLIASLASARIESAGFGVLLALTGAFMAVVALVGGRQAAAGEISIGQLVAAVGLTQFLIGPLSRLAGFGAVWARARASASRLLDLLLSSPKVENPARETAPDLPEPTGLTLRGLRSGSDLGDLDLEVLPGELLGVAPASAGTAESLVALLERSEDPEAGMLALGGTPFPELPLDALHEAVLVAPHDATLFSGTLRENVRPENGFPEDGSLDRERLVAALAASGADEVAASLPGGLSAPLGEGGRSLSGGQKQRVALARALAARSRVLVLHDPTTAVDAVTEAGISARLKALRSGETTVLVTTSPALLAAADRVVLLDGGRVAAEGSHTTLLAASEAYRSAVLG